MTSLCTFLQLRLKGNTQQALPGTSQDFSVVRLHDILLERHDDVSRGCNNDVPSVRLIDVSNKSQIKKPNSLSRHQDVSEVRILDVPLVRLSDVSCKSQMKYSIMSLHYVSATSQSCVVAALY